jgi:hypothetical protein
MIPGKHQKNFEYTKPHLMPLVVLAPLKLLTQAMEIKHEQKQSN